MRLGGDEDRTSVAGPPNGATGRWCLEAPVPDRLSPSPRPPFVFIHPMPRPGPRAYL